MGTLGDHGLPRVEHWVSGSGSQPRDTGEPGDLLGSTGLEPQLCCCHCEQVPACLCASVSPLLERLQPSVKAIFIHMSFPCMLSTEILLRPGDDIRWVANSRCNRWRPCLHKGDGSTLQLTVASGASGHIWVLKNSKKRANETPWVKPTQVRCRKPGGVTGVTAAGLWRLGCGAGGMLSPLPRHWCHPHPTHLAQGSSAASFFGGERLNGTGRQARSVPERASRGAEGDEPGPVVMPAGDRAQGVPRRTGQFLPPPHCQPGGRFLGSQSIVTAPAFENPSR